MSRAPDTITCPKCGVTSHNPNDVREGYCGNCHDFTSGAFSQLAYAEWLETGQIPEWRQKVLTEGAIKDAVDEAFDALRSEHSAGP